MNTETKTKDFDCFIELVSLNNGAELKQYLYSYDYKGLALESTNEMKFGTTIAGWNIKLKQK